MAEDCSSAHCGAQQGNVNQICKDEGWPVGHKVLVCDTSGYCCNCHCSCLEFGTPVYYGTGDRDFKAVEMYKKGEKVIATGADVTSWNEYTVEFSNGTDPGAVTPFLVRVKYDLNGEEGSMLVTEDNLFLMPNSKLKRADQLVAGVDKLVCSTGISDTAMVTKVERETGDKGVHHISTGTAKPQTMDGHLLNVQGIVVADYVLQLYQDELPQFMDDGSGDTKMGAVGSEGYDALHNAKTSMVRNEIELEQLVSSGVMKNFTYWPHTIFSTTLKSLPEAGDVSFVTDNQAQELEEFAPKNSYFDTAVIAEVEYLITIFEAFYPEIHFILDWPTEKPNAYSTVLGGDNIVVITGGLARIKEVGLQAMSVIMSHQVGRFYGGQPERPDGYSCTGTADYYGVRIVMRKLWYDDLYATMVFPGVDQIQAMFQYMSNGRTDVCTSPTLACRIQTLRAGATSPELPACAGGPSEEYLTVKSAESETAGQVTIKFNQSVDKTTAENVAHYELDPGTTIDSATVNTGDTSKVTLSASGMVSGDDYRVSVENVMSADKENMNPSKASVDFTAM